MPQTPPKNAPITSHFVLARLSRIPTLRISSFVTHSDFELRISDFTTVANPKIDSGTNTRCICDLFHPKIAGKDAIAMQDIVPGETSVLQQIELKRQRSR